MTSTLVFAALGFAYVLFADRLPPRTPLKVARTVSGLAVPTSAHVLSFRDEWSGMNGDGVSETRIQLTADSFATLVAAARAEGYQQLSSASEDSRFVRGQTDVGADGLFQLKRGRDLESYELTVLDQRTLRLLVRVVVQ